MMIIAAESSYSLCWPSGPKTGTHSEDDALTVGEEKELQFHSEFGETPPASPTVAAFEAYISDTTNNLESSLPGRGGWCSKVYEAGFAWLCTGLIR